MNPFYQVSEYNITQVSEKQEIEGTETEVKPEVYKNSFSKLHRL